MLAAAFLVTVLAFGCRSDATPSSPTELASTSEAATAEPSPTPLAAASARPVAEGVSQWGWPGVEGEFAFLTLTVTPGASPEADPWTFDLGGGPTPCRPERSASGWSFTSCSTRPGNRLRATIEGDIELELEVRIDGRDFSGTLVRVQEREEPLATPNVTRLWNAPGGNTGIWAADGVVFAPQYGGQVALLDAVSGERLSIVETGGASGRGFAAALEVTARDGYLYVATVSNGVVIFDVRDPRNPRRAGQFMVDAGQNNRETFTNVHTLFLGPDGRTLYAINQSHAMTDMRIIDVSNPAAPREAGRYFRPEIGEILDGFHQVYVEQRPEGTIAFLHSLRSGMFILDVSNPREVRELGSIKLPNTLSHSGATFEVAGKLYYAHHDEGFDQGMTVLDVSNLGDPKVVSTYKTRRGISIHNIDIVGGIAYIAYYVDGLRVVDLRDPAAPREIGHYDTVAPGDERGLFQGSWGVKYLDGRVYLSDMETGVHAFEVALP